MQGPNVHFAKIVATPTPTAWSQAYNAGSLFAVLSLSADDSPESLMAVGKEFFNNLEAEFFTLEEKTLTSIKDAITKSCEHIPDTIHVSLNVAYIKDTMLYLFVRGGGKILFKRDASVGILLAAPDTTDAKTMHTASGYLKVNDTVLLLTEQFLQVIATNDIQQAVTLDSPNDIAETLSPKLHETMNGGAAGIILTFKGSPTHVAPHALEVAAETELPEEEATEEIPAHPTEHPSFTVHDGMPHPSTSPLQTIQKRALALLHKLPTPRQLSFGAIKQMGGKRNLFLALAVIIAVALIGTVINTRQQQEKAKASAHFNEVYAAAQKQVDEGSSLLGLNKNLAREDFQAAKKILDDAKDDFKTGSDEQKRILALLDSVNKELENAGSAAAVQASPTDVAKNSLLAVAKDNNSALAVGEDTSTVYVIGDKNVSAVTKNSGKQRTIITNNKDWQDAKAIGSYLGNIYILDTDNGVLKYVAAGSSYSKSSYFSGDTPSLTNAVSMAIDGSVWILSSNGTIDKYTKGKAVSFKITGLDGTLKGATRIVTSSDINNVYILDNGNSRIVKLNKDGVYQAQWQASVLKTAKEMTIDEAGKKAFILQYGKTFFLELK